MRHDPAEPMQRTRHPRIRAAVFQPNAEAMALRQNRRPHPSWRKSPRVPGKSACALEPSRPDSFRLDQREGACAS